MLGILRKYRNSPVIMVMFWLIVASFVGTIFLIWGKGETGAPTSYAAKVNGVTISYEAYRNAYLRLREFYQQILGPQFTAEQEQKLNLRKQALDSLIDGVLLRQEGKRLGIVVKPDEVQAAIARMSEFQNNGAFDFQRYQQVLRGSRLTPQAFEESQKDALFAQKTREKIRSNASVSDADLLQAYRKQTDKLDLAFAIVDPASLQKGLTLTDAELEDYLKRNGERFRTPEEIRIAWLQADPARLTAGLTVSDADAENYYQKNLDRYQDKGEILPFAKVKERVRSDARQQLAAKEAFAKVAELQQQSKGDLAVLAKSLGTKPAETGLFTANSPPAALKGDMELVSRAFQAKEGELLGPLETKRGLYVVKLLQRKPAALPPLAQVRSQVQAGAAVEKAKGLAQKQAEELQAKLAKGSDGIKLQQTGTFSYAANGAIPKLGTSVELMNAAFELSKESPAPKGPFKIGERWVAVRLASRSEADMAAFAQQKATLQQNLLPKKQADYLEQRLAELRKQAKIVQNQALLSE